MKQTLNDLIKLADKFENKLIKFADNQEADSTVVTLQVRPTVNMITSNANWSALLQRLAVNLAAKNVTGSLKIEEFVLNAIDTNSSWKEMPDKANWKIDLEKTGFIVTGGGDLVNHPEVIKLLAALKNKIVIELTKQLNRLSKTKTIVGNKITDHKTDIATVEVAI